jgi:hypothetical protein
MIVQANSTYRYYCYYGSLFARGSEAGRRGCPGVKII